MDNFRIGDIVRIARKSEVHIPWGNSMARTVGKTGLVVEILQQGVRVLIQGPPHQQSWAYEYACLELELDPDRINEITKWYTR